MRNSPDTTQEAAERVWGDAGLAADARRVHEHRPGRHDRGDGPAVLQGRVADNEEDYGDDAIRMSCQPSYSNTEAVCPNSVV